MALDKTGNFILNQIYVYQKSVETISKETGMDVKVIERIRDVSLDKLKNTAI